MTGLQLKQLYTGELFLAIRLYMIREAAFVKQRCQETFEAWGILYRMVDCVCVCVCCVCLRERKGGGRG